MQVCTSKKISFTKPIRQKVGEIGFEPFAAFSTCFIHVSPDVKSSTRWFAIYFCFLRINVFKGETILKSQKEHPELTSRRLPSMDHQSSIDGASIFMQCGIDLPAKGHRSFIDGASFDYRLFRDGHCGFNYGN